jgi:hypothetical protein
VRLFRIGIIATAALTALVAVVVVVTLPPAPLQLGAIVPPTHVPGAYHVHSTRSDGTGTIEEIAAAAAQTGLGFVILTDHGDGTRPPDPPQYRQGVLVIDAVEINTRDGHVVALGLDRASSYPLAGLAVDVVADIHRMGGTAIVAHPDSPRPELAWRGGPGLAGADALEWLNVDSEWRDDSSVSLVGRLVHGFLRPEAAVAALFSRPERTLQRWDSTARQRPIAGLAAVDAHASIPWRDQQEPRQSSAIAWPSYATLFQTLTQTAVLDAPLVGDAASDARRLVDSLARGQSYSTVRAQAWPSTLHLTATQGESRLAMGQRVQAGRGRMTIEAASPGAPGVRLQLLRDGIVETTGLGSLRAETDRPGIYRVEGWLPGHRVPWLVSNSIAIEGSLESNAGTGGRGRAGRGGRGESIGTVEPALVSLDSDRWKTEQDGSSTASVLRENGRVGVAFQLAAGIPRGQYVALVHDIGSADGVQLVRFVAHANAPMRLSVQVRLPEGRGRTAQRWRRSIFVDQTPRPFELLLEDFESADRPTVRRPIVTPLQSLLFVADTINSSPGSSGTFWVEDLALGINRLATP